MLAYLPSNRSTALFSVSGWSKLSEIKAAALADLKVEPALMMFWWNNVSDGEENDLQQTNVILTCVCINCIDQIWNAYLQSSRMLSFGRGKGLSFRAGVDMSPFKAETTRAFLNLFPRSRITIGIREDVDKEHTSISGYLHRMCSQPTWKQIIACLTRFFLVWRIGSQLKFMRYVYIWHLILKRAAFILLNMLVATSEIN